MKILNAAVIGLGNIGFRFNLDPKRSETWTHVAAYEKAEKTRLAGVVEIDDENIRTFRQIYKDVPVFKTVREMMENIDVDIVSVCTPPHTHCPILKELIEYPVRAIFCEKPLASSFGEAEEIMRMYKEKQIILAVNHTRRWENSYVHVQQLIDEGSIGKVSAVNAFYPAQIFNIGTHLLDVIRMLIRKDPVVASGISSNLDNNDPDISGWIMFSGDIPCTVVSTGKREDLIFEIDIIGDEGRIRVTENGDKIECFSFIESSRYSGYRELSLVESGQVSTGDRFVQSINDIVRAVEDKDHTVNCTGRDGYYALAMSFTMLASARLNGVPVEVRGQTVNRNKNHPSEKERNAEVSSI